MRSVTSNGTVTKDFLYDLGGSIITEMSGTGSINRQEAYAGGRHLAIFSGTATVLFAHSDWQGTERVRTTTSGAIDSSYTNMPFGDLLNSVGASPKHFTDKERDAETGEDYFGARYYNSTLGRFITPDWADKPTAVPYAEFGDPQSLNLYGYVRNNPTTRTDADGHCWPACELVARLASWVGLGVAEQGAKQFAKNVGIGLAKGAGQVGVGLVAGAALQAGPGAFVRLALSKTGMKAMNAVTPSNQTQAEVAPVGAAIATTATTMGLSAGVGAMEGAVETTTLYRAVDAAELGSIEETTSFLPSPNGTLYKGFFFNESDAQSFGSKMTEMTGEAHTVVQGEAPTSLVQSSPPHIAAGEGPGTLIHNDNLPQVTVTPKQD